MYCSVTADVSDGEAKAETLAVRFANTESAYVRSTAWSMLLKTTLNHHRRSALQDGFRVRPREQRSSGLQLRGGRCINFSSATSWCSPRRA